MNRSEILEVLTNSNGERQFKITCLLPSDTEYISFDCKLITLEGEYIIVESIVTGNRVPIRLERIKSITKLEGI